MKCVQGVHSASVCIQVSSMGWAELEFGGRL